MIVTSLVLVMVFVLPWIDRRLCRRLGLDLQGGVSANPKAEALLRLRRGLLYAVFVLYLLAVAWLVFFSRAATNDYQVHVALFEDLKNAVRIDFGLFDLLRIAFTEGFGQALTHIRVSAPEDISQVYMNIMLFVPMGYLLPYVSDWFRARVRWRPAAACLIISFLIENLQLVARRGFYDMDDLVSNALGGLLGQWLFIWLAYVVTHPAWRKELKAYRRWKRNARTRTLYPFARRMGVLRTTLLATDEEAVWDFYVMKLGFRLVRQLVPLDSDGTDMLLQLGRSQLEFHCSNRRETLPPQSLTISARRLKPVLRRLEMNGIETSGITQDVYTMQRCVRFNGPDDTTITVTEQ